MLGVKLKHVSKRGPRTVRSDGRWSYPKYFAGNILMKSTITFLKFRQWAISLLVSCHIWGHLQNMCAVNTINFDRMMSHKIDIFVSRWRMPCIVKWSWNIVFIKISAIFDKQMFYGEVLTPRRWTICKAYQNDNAGRVPLGRFISME